MDFIAARLARHRAESQSHTTDGETARRAYCNDVNYSTIATAVVRKLITEDRIHTWNSAESMDFEGQERAAWLLRDWPPHDLPHDVKSYKVYLIALGETRAASGIIVSVRVWYSGQYVVERYDPDRYGDETIAAMTVYTTASQLPGDHFFTKEHTPAIFLFS